MQVNEGWHFNCVNCGADDFAVDGERGDCVCRECGCVDRVPLSVGGNGYSARLDCNGNQIPGVHGYESINGASIVMEAPPGRKKRKGTSPPYRRDTYFAERISQWRMHEPGIPTPDAQEIERAYDYFTDKWGTRGGVTDFPGAVWSRTERGLRCSYVINKEDCRQLLWHIDAQRSARGAKPYFVKKYLVSFFLFFSSWSFVATKAMSSPLQGMQRGT